MKKTFWKHIIRNSVIALYSPCLFNICLKKNLDYQICLYIQYFAICCFCLKFRKKIQPHTDRIIRNRTILMVFANNFEYIM